MGVLEDHHSEVGLQLSLLNWGMEGEKEEGGVRGKRRERDGGEGYEFILLIPMHQINGLTTPRGNCRIPESSHTHWEEGEGLGQCV